MLYEGDIEAVARFYDGDYAVYRTGPAADVVFYVEEATRSGGPVAEFGCGTGRVLIPTLQAGVEVDGVDLLPSMIDVARAKVDALGVTARLEVGDMRDFDLGREYALVTIPFRALSHVYETDDQVRVMKNMKRHLRPDGRLIFDVFQPKLQILSVAGKQPEQLDFEREEDGKKVRRYHTIEVEAWRQLSHVGFRWEVESPDGSIEERATSFDMRWFFRFELEHVVARAGLAIEAVYGDFGRAPVGPDSPELVFLARVPADEATARTPAGG